MSARNRSRSKACLRCVRAVASGAALSALLGLGGCNLEWEKPDPASPPPERFRAAAPRSAPPLRDARNFAALFRQSTKPIRDPGRERFRRHTTACSPPWASHQRARSAARSTIRQRQEPPVADAERIIRNKTVLAGAGPSLDALSQDRGKRFHAPSPISFNGARAGKSLDRRSCRRWRGDLRAFVIGSLAQPPGAPLLRNASGILSIDVDVMRRTNGARRGLEFTP